MQSLCYLTGTVIRTVSETMVGSPIRFERMKDELESFEAFIGDAERLDAVEETKEVILRKTVKQVIEAAFRLEDVIDEYKISEKQRPGDDVSVYAAIFSCDIPNVLQTMVLRHKMKYRYEDFRFQFFEIKEHFEKYGFQSTSRQQNPGSPAFDIIDEEDIVGFEAPSDELVSWLLDGNQERTLISVVGMGGLGKTTLSRKVFRSHPVANHFDCCEWFTVSQSYTIEVLLKHMWDQFFYQSGDSYPTTIELVITRLREFLRRRRYVVFFDDVWDLHFWDNIISVLPENMNGSRIFITTRNMNVAMHCNSYFNVKVHLLQSLTHEESSELFYRKAFREFRGGIPEPLQDISSEIIRKCNGNPLAISAVGIFLSHKSKTMSEWKRFSRNFSYVIQKDPMIYRTIKTLSLSYNDLPLPLKPCLLYFAMYPPNYEVKSKRLIRQWIAEGFVKEEPDKTLEEVAEGYLTELIDRSLVLGSLVSIDGKVKGCRVHDLIREMILRKVDNLRFCKYFTTEDDPSAAFSGIIRRLSIAATLRNDVLMENPENRESSSHLRSLFFFTEKELPEKLVSSILAKHKLLKILDFESASSCHVPQNFGVLIHLKYLSLRNTEMLSLPKSIGKLQNLETLDLRQTTVNKLPQEVSELRKLRHLLGENLSLINLKGSIRGMSSLQTLSEVAIDEDETDLITELEMLTELRKLSLFDVRKGQGPALCSSISKMPLLEKLCIETYNKDEVIDLSFVPYPTKLRKLRLQARLNELPVWIPELENLVELSLSYSYLTEDPLESLKSLPNLLVLNLAVDSYEGKSLHFQEKGFQKLKELSLRYLNNLSSIIVDGEPLPCLEKITFMKISNLKELPNIFNLKKLPVLNSYFMPAEFDEKIAPWIKDKMSKKI